MAQPLYVLELNEVNFDFVKHYASKGLLPCFAHLMQRHGVGTTSSEAAYKNIEPWIQWVSAHTGKTFDEHKIFRLGDIIGSDLEQIWELLEKRGLRVGAISPMNAVNRLQRAAFFVPDSWTASSVSADRFTTALYRAVCQAVGDNAAGRVTVGSVLGLFGGFFRHVSPARWPAYVRLANRLPGRPWAKAIALDQLLGDVFISLVSQHRPDFATLFLNAAAHIQHHYLFSSSAYGGTKRNPSWYVPTGQDPILDIYRTYDDLLRRILNAFPASRILIATGLHQDPYPTETIYWRLRQHSAFLTSIGLAFESVEALMSRDFVLHFGDAEKAHVATRTLENARVASNDRSIFQVDNRGLSLFCTLIYDKDIDQDETLLINGKKILFREQVEFVAIKNAHHNGVGYLLDTANSSPSAPQVPITQIFHSVVEHFSVPVSA